MPLMEWSATLDVGVEAMNAEHRDILKAMNGLYDAALAGEEGAAMMARIRTLATITARHFADEEKFMEKVGFPGLEAHKSMHAKLLSDYTEHARMAEAAGGKPSDKFFHFLNLWLSAHIKHIDRKYGDHARTASARAA